ncbi:MAG: PAS domain-containing protein [Phycisphaerales bacterium]|nr:PAS domain-containing protein [Planctomycetota bacterium]MCH8509833.1 PAS domain-containing protein [Phycisphaerales bacterium]
MDQDQHQGRQETERIGHLRSLQILDSSPEEAFDRIVRIASVHLGTPAAAISLVDADRVWLKSQVGLPCNELPREESICSDCIAGGGPLVLSDIAKDERFRDLPLVRDAGFRFYAGVPIVTADGHALGTICVLDTEPREIDAADLRVLEDLAVTTGELIRIRLASVRADGLLRDLEQSDGRLTLLSHVAARTDNAVIITDPAGRIEWVNEGFTRVSGYELPAVLGRTPGSVLQGPGTDPSTVEQMRSCLRRGEGFKTEILNYARDGREYWLDIEVQPVRNDQGEITNFIAIERDITEEKRRNQELESNRTMIKSVLDSCLEGVVMFEAVRDADGTIIDMKYLLVSSSAERILNRPSDELIGRRLLECYPVHTRTGIIQTLTEVIESGEHCTWENEYEDRDIRGWFRNSATRLNDGVVITFSDLTMQHESMLEIQRSHERFRLLTEATEDIVWDYDITTGMVWWGDNIRIRFGHDLDGDQAPIEAWSEWVHEDDRAAATESFESALRGTDTHWSAEYRFRRKDGTYAVVLDRGFIMRDEDGKAYRALGAAIDLTERREAAEQIAFQSTLLEAQADASPDAILVTDQQGRVIRTNARLRRALGSEQPDPNGLDAFGVLSSLLAGSEAAGELIHRAALDGGPAQSAFDRHVSLPDGRDLYIISEPLSTDGSGNLGRVWFLRDVTETRRTEQLLRQHNLVVENSNVVLFRWRPEPGWPVELVSHNVDQFGYSAEDLLNNRVQFAELVHPDDRERIGAEVQAYIESGVGGFEQEYRIVCKDGQVRWTLDRTVIDRDADGHVVSLQGVIVDIHDRKQTEEALRETQNKLRDIAAQVPGAVYQYRLKPDGSCEIPYMSEGIAELCQITPEQLYHNPLLIRAQVPEEDLEAFDRSIIESAEKMTPWKCEFRVRRPDGSCLTLGGRSDPKREPDGSVLWHGMLVDLTEQKRVEHAHRRLAAILERTNSIAHVGGWEINAITGDMWWSDEVYRIYDLEPGDMPGLPGAINFYREDARPTIAAAIENAMRTGEPWDLELPLITAAGREIWVHTQCEAVREGGRVIRLRGAIQDITHAHRSREELALRAVELEHLRDEAEAANRAKSEFIANMSHEIRTPLTSILGYTELIRDGDDKAESAEWRRTTAETILAAGDHLMTVINDILDISKIEAGQMTVDQTPTELARIVREVLRISSVRAEAKRVRLDAVLSAPVPDTIVIDPTRLRQILMNLLGNAVKFTECGSITLRIGREQAGGEDRLLIDIEDTGPGITEDQHGRLFCKFSQADASLTRRHGGTGLGLVLSKRFANLMGGDVSLLWSRAGEGSCFRIDLPLRPAEGAGRLESLEEPSPVPAPARPAAQAPMAAVAGSHALRGRILLAEDGPDNQRLITFHLRKAGADVDIADNGAVALELVRIAAAEGRPYDLLLTDIQMPEMDGHTLARILRESGSDLPIVALTAHAMPEDRQRCIDSGCDDYATKPIDRAALIETCAHWMTRRHQPSRSAA